MASVNSRAELFPNRAFTPMSGSDEAMEEDPEWQVRRPLKPRHHSSYENMSNSKSTEGFVDDPAHQYEDPGRLTQEDSFHDRRSQRSQHSQRSQGRHGPLPSKPTPRKKMNEAYEPVHGKQRKRTFTDDSEDSDGFHRRTCGKLIKVLAFVGFLLSLAAVVMVLLLLLGVLSVSGCQDCKKELVPAPGTAASESSQELWRMIAELKSNVSALNAAVRRKDEDISQLQRRDTEHTDRILDLEQKAKYRVFINNGTNFNLSELIGPKGPPGMQGPVGEAGEKGVDGEKGERGPGNLTLCRYELSESTPFTADARGNGMNVAIVEPQGKRIVGVSCSTYGTTEYNLKSQLVDSTRQYECECRGRSTLFPINGPDNGKARCYIHYWVCPLIS